MMTPKHVLESWFAATKRNLYCIGGTKMLVPTGRIHYVVMSSSDGLDTVLFKLTNKDWSLLGATAYPVATSIVGDNPIIELESHCHKPGSVCYSSSKLEMAPSRPAWHFYHTSTTAPGDSGIPVFIGDKVVGMHLGSDSGAHKNYCVILTTLFRMLHTPNRSPVNTETESAAMRGKYILEDPEEWTEENDKYLDQVYEVYETYDGKQRAYYKVSDQLKVEGEGKGKRHRAAFCNFFPEDDNDEEFNETHSSDVFLASDQQKEAYWWYDERADANDLYENNVAISELAELVNMPYVPQQQIHGLAGDIVDSFVAIQERHNATFLTTSDFTALFNFLPAGQIRTALQGAIDDIYNIRVNDAGKIVESKEDATERNKLMKLYTTLMEDEKEFGNNSKLWRPDDLNSYYQNLVVAPSFPKLDDFTAMQLPIPYLRYIIEMQWWVRGITNDVRTIKEKYPFKTWDRDQLHIGVNELSKSVTQESNPPVNNTAKKQVEQVKNNESRKKRKQENTKNNAASGKQDISNTKQRTVGTTRKSQTSGGKVLATTGSSKTNSVNKESSGTQNASSTMTNFWRNGKATQQQSVHTTGSSPLPSTNCKSQTTNSPTQEQQVSSAISEDKLKEILSGFMQEQQKLILSTLKQNQLPNAATVPTPPSQN